MVARPLGVCFRFLSICLLALSAAGMDGVAAQSSSPEDGNRVVAVFVSVEPRGSLTFEEVEFLRSGLLTSLSSSLEDYSFVLSREQRPEQERDTQAVAVGADSWLSAVLVSTASEVRVELSVKDLYYDDPGTDLVYRLPLTADFRGNTGRYWFPAIDLVRSRLLAPGYQALLSISGFPGTVVTGFADNPVVLDSDGQGAIRIPVGETLRFDAAAVGYHSVEGTIRATTPELELLLNQPPRGRFSYDLFLTGFSYPGGGVSFHLVPAWSLIRLDVFSYALGFIPYANIGGDQGRLFASEPVSHLTTFVLQHLVSPDQWLRPYLGMGATIRVVHSEGTIEKEPIAPYGVTAVLGAELTRRYGAWFFEYAPLLYFVEEPELWDRQFTSRQPGYVRIGSNVLDVMMVRVGFRYTPPGWK